MKRRMQHTYRRELVQGAINLHKVSLQEHLKLLDIKLLGDGAVGGAIASSMAVPTNNIVQRYFRSGPK